MPQFTGEKKFALPSTNNSFDPCEAASPRKTLDPVLKLKLAEFALFLDSIEDCTQALRVDQLEDVIGQAVATCGFDSPGQARAKLEWMFHQALELS
jgi:hypothetical protein